MRNLSKVLIADDDPDIIESLAMMLEDENCVVEGVCGKETIEKVNNWLPHLLFLDLWMPGMNGREICERLKGQALTRHIPIIMFSANRDAETIAAEVNADGLLAKPFEMEDVLALVRKYCHREYAPPKRETT